MSPSEGAPTNEEIVRLLEALRAELAELVKGHDRMARDVERLLKQTTA